jgi:lipid-A-disaccharide synthase
MLPGSRAGEVARLLPDFVAALKRLQTGRQPLAIVVPTVAGVAGRVRAALAGTGLDPLIVEGEQERFDAFAAAEVALAKSGTVTLELALSGVPAIIAYKINPLTHAIVAPRITGRFAGLPNVILDRLLMPEFLQQECRPEFLAAELARLLDDPDARAAQLAGAREVQQRLSVPGATPSAAAADAVLAVIAQRRSIGTKERCVGPV